MTRHMIDTMSYHTDCGGALLGDGQGTGYLYCDQCGAFRAGDDEDEDFPTGTDREQNREAYDAGESRSPDAFDAFGDAVMVSYDPDTGLIRQIGAAEVEAWDEVCANADATPERVSQLIGWGKWTILYRVTSDGADLYYFVAN